MRKLYLICLTLILGIALVLPMALPAAAAPKLVGMVVTERNVTAKQAATVPWGEGMGHVFLNIMVKKYSDGTIDGHINIGSAPDNTKSYCFEFVSADFIGNTAVIIGWFHQAGFADPVLERWTLIDNGEPAIGKSMINIEFYILPPELYDGWYSVFGLGSGPVYLINHAVIKVYSGS